MTFYEHLMVINRIIARYEEFDFLVECLREDSDVVLVNLEVDIEEYYDQYVEPLTIMNVIEWLELWYF